MNGKKLRLGLVGKDVSNSLSEKIHSFILGLFGYDVEYENVSVSMENFDGAARYLLGDFDGFNITIPYKRDILEYLDGVSGDAMACGAVNTVVCSDRMGYNTDGAGFSLMLKVHGVDVRGASVLLLGGGGAGRSCAVALKGLGASVSMYRRNREELEEVCEQLDLTAAEDPERGGYDVVINATGVGMHDTVGCSPVGEKAFAGAKVAVDLISRPEPSAFLEIASRLGLKTVSGKAMLFLQAYYADCLFLGKTPCETEAEEFYHRYLEKEKSI